MTLEHITNLPDVIKKTFKLLDKEGVFQIAIPCEGEKAFELAWKMTTGLAFRIKYGLDYSIIMSHEHVNTKEEIEIILKRFFKIVKFKRSPFFLPIRNFSFYCYFECKKII